MGGGGGGEEEGRRSRGPISEGSDLVGFGMDLEWAGVRLRPHHVVPAFSEKSTFRLFLLKMTNLHAPPTVYRPYYSHPVPFPTLTDCKVRILEECIR